MASKKQKPKRRSGKPFSLPVDFPFEDEADRPADWECPPIMNATSGKLDPEQLEQLKVMLGFDQLVWRSLKTVAATTLFFGLLGSATGCFLGLFFPSYLRHCFDAADRIDFQAWEIGLGHGLVWGSITGAVAGGLAVLAAAIYQTRMLKNLPSTEN